MHIIVWEFRVRPGREREFEKVCGPRGEWARLFTRSEGYLGSEIHRDVEMPGRYLVIDRWASREALEVFRSRWRAKYEALDRRCEALTERETRLGAFTPPGKPVSER